MPVRGVECPRHAKTDGSIAEKQPVGGRVPAAIGGAEISRICRAFPGAASQTATGAVSGWMHVVIVRRIFVAPGLTVFHPLPHVPVDVVQAKPVRSEGAHRRRPPSVPTASAPVAICAVAPDVVSPPVARRRPSPGHVFPLGLAQQPIPAPRPVGKPAHIFPGIVPIHVDNRAIAAAPALIVGTVRASSGFVARIPLGESDLVPAHCEGFPDRHHMDRAFVRVSIHFFHRRAHREGSFGRHDHLGTFGTVTERRPCGLRGFRLPETGAGEVGQVSRGRLRQAHDLDDPVSGDEKLPLSHSVAQTTGELAGTVFELL